MFNFRGQFLFPSGRFCLIEYPRVYPRRLLLNRRLSRTATNMANISTPVPKLKLNDGMSIPMVSSQRLTVFNALKPDT